MGNKNSIYCRLHQSQNPTYLPVQGHTIGRIESYMDNIALLVQQRISQDIEIVVEIVVEQSNLKMHIKYVCNNNEDYIWNCTEQKKYFEIATL